MSALVRISLAGVFLFYGKVYSLPYTEDAAYHLHIRQKMGQ